MEEKRAQRRRVKTRVQEVAVEEETTMTHKNNKKAKAQDNPVESKPTEEVNKLMAGLTELKACVLALQERVDQGPEAPPKYST